MDSRFIDVALGLVLVFVITSLLVTTLQEIWTTRRGNRGLNLRRAIESFVGDDTVFAKTLLDHPLLVSLSPQPVQKAPLPSQTVQKEIERKPSYIGADAIVAALIDLLVQGVGKGERPTSPLELVDTVLQESKKESKVDINLRSKLVPNFQFAQGLISLARGAEQDWPAFEARVAAWYNAVGERSIGWFKRDVQISLLAIGFVTAAVLNINPIHIATRLWDDETLRDAFAKAAERYNAANNGADSVLRTSADVEPKKTEGQPLTGTSPKSTGENGGGGDKSLAFTPADLSAPLDEYLRAMESAMVARDLTVMTSTALRDAAINGIELGNAIAVWQKSTESERKAAGEKIIALLDTSLRGLPNLLSLKPLRDTHANLQAVTLDALRPLAFSAQGQGNVNKDLASAGTSSTESLHTLNCEAYKEESMKRLCLSTNELWSLREAGLPIGWSRAAFPTVFDERRCSPKIKGDSKPVKADCDGYNRILDGAWWGNILVMIFGWFITAVACTLGAPFWFDILGKFVKLRTAGNKPESPPHGGGGCQRR